jgi:hypothetical protein
VKLFVVGAVIIAFNAMVLWTPFIRKEEALTVMPIVEGLIAATGIVLLNE